MKENSVVAKTTPGQREPSTRRPASLQNLDGLDWDIDISGGDRRVGFDLREVHRYRDLLWLLVRRDFVAQYRQTILGPLWHLLHPLLTTLMLLVVFGKLAGIPTDSIEPPVMFYLAGVSLWSYFSAVFTGVTLTFVNNAQLFGKVYFPRIILPLSVAISQAIRLVIQVILIVALFLFFRMTDQAATPVNWRIMLVPGVFILVAGIAIGLGLAVAAITTKYRDIANLTTFSVQLLMYVTPVAYPLSFARSKSLGWIIEWNPLTAPFEAFRYCLFGSGTLIPEGLAYAVIVFALSLIAGIVLFSSAERTFIDTV